MNEFTKEDLEIYIKMRRSAIAALMNSLGGTDLYGLQISLNELQSLEDWFGE